MESQLTAVETNQRNIPAGMIDDARRHVYEAAIRTPLVRLNYAAPAAKVDSVRRLGGEVVQTTYDECWKALGARAHPAMTGAFVHPFEDDGFIAGNASAGLEILEDLPDVDAVVAGFGGGGLSCGI